MGPAVAAMGAGAVRGADGAGWPPRGRSAAGADDTTGGTTMERVDGFGIDDDANATAAGGRLNVGTLGAGPRGLRTRPMAATPAAAEPATGTS